MAPNPISQVVSSVGARLGGLSQTLTTAQAEVASTVREMAEPAVRTAESAFEGLRRLPGAVSRPVRARTDALGPAAHAAFVGALGRAVHPAILASIGLTGANAASRVTEPKPDAARVATLPKTLFYRIERTPNREAFLFPGADGQWESMTWKAVGERVKDIAGGLLALGLAHQDRAAILSGTRVEWVLADLATISAGGVTTTIFPSNGPSECQHILSDSGAKIVFVEDDQQLAKLVALRQGGALPGVAQVINIAGAERADGWALGLSELVERGRAYNAANPGQFEILAESVQPDDLATLIYTSGTTGAAKGVELTHGAWAFQQEAAAELGFLTGEDKQYLWLPLAHSFGKFLEGAAVRLGIPTAIDGRVKQLAANLTTVEPTFVAAVPRVFENIYNGIVSQAKEAGGKKYEIFKWAVGVGLRVSRVRQAGGEPNLVLATEYALADTLVFSKIRARLGGNLRFFLSGGAPLSPEIAEFMHAAGITVLEGYGLTETSGASHVNRLQDFRFGSVGRPLPGVDQRLDPETGEIQLRGRNIMRGYFGNPEETARNFTADGWFKTGDKGEIGPGAHLRITDRIKNLFKTSNGKYVAPQPLETKLKTLSPIISQVVVHGVNRKFCSALFTVDESALKKFASHRGLSALSYAELTQHPAVRAEIEGAVAAFNAGHDRHEEHVQKFAILPADFSVETGELTPSLKVKRSEVEKKFKSTLDAFYDGDIARL